MPAAQNPVVRWRYKHSYRFAVAYGQPSISRGIIQPATAVSIGFSKGMGQMYAFLKYKMGEYGGADEPQKLQNFGQTFK